jgi:hypothetical protein
MSTQQVLLAYPGSKMTVRHLGTAKQGSGGGLTSFTFSTFNGGGNGLGSATSNKQIVVCVTTVSGAVAAQGNIQIAGSAPITSSIIVNPPGNIAAAIYKAVVTATSGNIVVNCTGLVNDCSIDVYEVMFANTGAALSTASDTTISSGVLTTSQTSAYLGAVFSVIVNNLSAGSRPAWAWTDAVEFSDEAHIINTPFGFSSAVKSLSNPGTTVMAATLSGTAGANQYMVSMALAPA